jgi:hypothetical protein
VLAIRSCRVAITLRKFEGDCWSLSRAKVQMEEVHCVSPFHTHPRHGSLLKEHGDCWQHDCFTGPGKGVVAIDISCSPAVFPSLRNEQAGYEAFIDDTEIPPLQSGKRMSSFWMTLFYWHHELLYQNGLALDSLADMQNTTRADRRYWDEQCSQCAVLPERRGDD